LSKDILANIIYDESIKRRVGLAPPFIKLRSSSMNYGENLVYWYLRLNGFFPLTNFVIHASHGVEYSSDCDVLAVRPPLVFEEIGGQTDDWDGWFLEHIASGKTLGVICEVKTGYYEKTKIFRKEYVRYAAKRLGFTNDEQDINRIAKDGAFAEIGERYRVIKLFVSNDERKGNFIHLRLNAIIQFLLDRINKYPEEKYRDRMFFHSILFQGLIEIKKMRESLDI
jgi:hypothetical protein